MALERKSQPGGRLAEHPAPALETRISELTEANRRLKRKLFDLYTLFEISRNLSGLLETERLLDNLLLTAIGQMGIGAAAVIVDRDEDDRYLKLWRAKGVSPPKQFAPRFDKEGGLLLRLQAVRMPLVWEEIARAHYVSAEDRETLRVLETAMVCPMVVKQQVRGILAVSRKLSGSPFSENDKEFLSILISQFTVAVDNARLYESERDAHARLREAQAQVVHSEKLAAMGRLSATIAHEVNNPLGIIKNYLHLMQTELNNGNDPKANLKVVSEEVNRIAEIVRRLLDFHRPASPVTRDFDLWHIIEDCLRLLEQSQNKQRVKVELPDSRLPAPVHANPEELKQVFLNLFMNALDAMPLGGRLSVRMIHRRRTLLVQVADTGTGITPETMPHLFEPFFTTKAEGQGTGLGLYVCYGIIKRHGGRIAVRNRKDGGAEFTIRLPLRETV
jgi:signal transduction histidine kinase